MRTRSTAHAFAALLLVTAVTALLSAPATPVHAQAQVTHLRGSFGPDGDFPNPYWDACTGEFVWLTGQVTFQLTVTVSPTGQVHFELVNDFSGISGLGLTTGNPYSFTGQGHINENASFTGTGALTFTMSNHANIISPGGSPNDRFYQQFHITINANGSVSVTVDKFEFVCHG